MYVLDPEHIDEAQDTLTITGLTDTVHASGGDVSSGNVHSRRCGSRSALSAGFSTPPTCTGGTGDGTSGLRSAAPGLTSCTLPFGSRLNVLPFSFYTVQPLDFNLPGHMLTDSVA